MRERVPPCARAVFRGPSAYARGAMEPVFFVRFIYGALPCHVLPADAASLAHDNSKRSHHFSSNSIVSSQLFSVSHVDS